MPFSTDFDFVRNSGKTRINNRGLVVGVDFSSSTTTIGVGTQGFVLDATAGVNRSWTVGESVLITDLIGGGTMIGTVISYLPATQSISINVTSVTGSGTSSSWRLGSRAVVRDPRTGAVNLEPAATNLVLFTEDFENAYWSKNGAGLGSAPVVTANFAVSPDGSLNADRIQFALNGGTAVADQSNLQTPNYAVLAGVTYVFSVWLKSNSGSNVAVRVEPISGINVLATVRRGFNQAELIVTPEWTRYSVAFSATTNTNAAAYVRLRGAANTADSADLLVWGAQLEVNEMTSYIPTRAVSASRVVDSVPFTSANNNRINPTEGTIIADIDIPAFGSTQKRIVRVDSTGGDIRLVKRGLPNLGTLGRSIEVDNDLFITGTQGQLSRCNGIEMSNVTFANDDRTGASSVSEASSVIAYDGSSTLLSNLGVVETLFNKNLSTVSPKGMGGTQLNGAHWNGNVFLMASNLTQRIFRSTDGNSYSRVNSPVFTQVTNEITSMMVGGTLRNVAVGATGFLATSDDNGLTWTTRSSGVTTAISGVTAGLGLFVYCRVNATTNIYTSPDGITWTSRTTATAQPQRDVAFNGTNLFVSVGDNGTIQTSPDGITWTARTSGTTQQLLGVSFGNGLWVAVGANGTILTSPNGTTWTVRTSGTTQQLNESIYFAAASLYVIVGNTTTCLTSIDGVTWTSRTLPPLATTNVNGLAVNGTTIIATGLNGYFISSMDGINWTVQSGLSTGTISGVAFGAGTFISSGGLGGGSGYVAKLNPTTGIVKRVGQSSFTTALGNCRFVNGLFYVFSASTNGLFWTSEDGDTWTQRTVSGSMGIIADVAFDSVNNKYVLVMTAGRVATSTNGVDFAGFDSGVNNNSLFTVVYFNNMFIAAGSFGRVITSPAGDLGTWTLRRSIADASGTTSQISNIFISNRDNMLYATGGAGGTANTNVFIYSTDGITWTDVNGSGFLSIQNVSGLQTSKLLGAFRTGRNRIAVSYKDNAVVASLNGVSVVDTTVTLPNFTAARLGFLGENMDGDVYDFRVYDKYLTQSEIEAMTLVL